MSDTTVQIAQAKIAIMNALKEKNNSDAIQMFHIKKQTSSTYKSDVWKRFGLVANADGREHIAHGTGFAARFRCKIVSAYKKKCG